MRTAFPFILWLPSLPLLCSVAPLWVICFLCCHYQVLNLEGIGQRESISFVTISAQSLLSLIRLQQYENTAWGMKVWLGPSMSQGSCVSKVWIDFQTSVCYWTYSFISGSNSVIVKWVGPHIEHNSDVSEVSNLNKLKLFVCLPTRLLWRILYVSCP